MLLQSFFEFCKVYFVSIPPPISIFRVFVSIHCLVNSEVDVLVGSIYLFFEHVPLAYPASMEVVAQVRSIIDSDLSDKRWYKVFIYYYQVYAGSLVRATVTSCIHFTRAPVGRFGIEITRDDNLLAPHFDAVLLGTVRTLQDFCVGRNKCYRGCSLQFLPTHNLPQYYIGLLGYACEGSLSPRLLSCLPACQHRPVGLARSQLAH